LFAKRRIEEVFEDIAAEFFKIISVFEDLVRLDSSNLIRKFEQTSA